MERYRLAGAIRAIPARIQAAQAAGDNAAYYSALHDYMHSIPDGHVMLFFDPTTEPEAVMRRQIGGSSFGLAMAELDDGSVIAAAVSTGGPAAVAGIVAGAQILKWNGVDISTAIGAVAPNSTVVLKEEGYTSPPATTEYYRLQQAALLTRAPVGAGVSVIFKNPGGAGQTVTLAAVDDSMSGLSLFTFTPPWDIAVRLGCGGMRNMRLLLRPAFLLRTTGLLRHTVRPVHYPYLR